MANRTVKDAISVKGTNPQYLVEKIIRTRIYDSRYWKEECFGLTSELLVDKAMELKSVGGVYGGNVKPTAFMCLILKMLQIQPEKDIIIEFIRNEDFKYVRALGAFYMRLTGSSIDVYKYLEPLYIDYRKMKRLNRNAKYELVHMDEFIDELLHGERVCDISLPRLQKRNVLEEQNELETRVSPLDVNLDDVESSSEEASSDESDDNSVDLKRKNEKDKRDRKKERSKSRSKSRERDRDRRRSRERNRSRTRSKSRSRSRNRDVKRSYKTSKYVDYDNPRKEDLEFYSSSRRRRSKTRSRSRSRSPSKKNREHKSSKKRNDSSNRDRNRSRSREREREKRSKERDRSNDRKKSSKR